MTRAELPTSTGRKLDRLERLVLDSVQRAAEDARDVAGMESREPPALVGLRFMELRTRLEGLADLHNGYVMLLRSLGMDPPAEYATALDALAQAMSEANDRAEISIGSLEVWN